MNETFQVAGLTVRIIRDDDADNPRKEYDHCGTMVCWHSRYELGDEQPDYPPSEFFMRLMQEREWDVHGKSPPDDLPDEHVQRYINKHFYVLPLYLYDHSGLSMSTGSFSDPWDSGQVGWIYLSEDKARAECIPDPLALLRSEVAAYDQYLTGDVWGYEVSDDTGIVLDSCWGYYGADHCVEDARSAAESCAETLDADFTI